MTKTVLDRKCAIIAYIFKCRSQHPTVIHQKSKLKFKYLNSDTLSHLLIRNYLENKSKISLVICNELLQCQLHITLLCFVIDHTFVYCSTFTITSSAMFLPEFQDSFNTVPSHCSFSSLNRT